MNENVILLVTFPYVFKHPSLPKSVMGCLEAF